jgi:hypothetical protein
LLGALSNAPGSTLSLTNALRFGALGLAFATHAILSDGLWRWAGDPIFAFIVLLADSGPAVGCLLVFFVRLLIVFRKPRFDAKAISDPPREDDPRTDST